MTAWTFPFTPFSDHARRGRGPRPPFPGQRMWRNFQGSSSEERHATWLIQRLFNSSPLASSQDFPRVSHSWCFWCFVGTAAGVWPWWESPRFSGFPVGGCWPPLDAWHLLEETAVPFLGLCVSFMLNYAAIGKGKNTSFPTTFFLNYCTCLYICRYLFNPVAFNSFTMHDPFTS